MGTTAAATFLRDYSGYKGVYSQAVDQTHSTTAGGIRSIFSQLKPQWWKFKTQVFLHVPTVYQTSNSHSKIERIQKSLPRSSRTSIVCFVLRILARLSPDSSLRTCFCMKNLTRIFEGFFSFSLLQCCCFTGTKRNLSLSSRSWSFLSWLSHKETTKKYTQNFPSTVASKLCGRQRKIEDRTVRHRIHLTHLAGKANRLKKIIKSHILHSAIHCPYIIVYLRTPCKTHQRLCTKNLRSSLLALDSVVVEPNVFVRS